MPSSLTWSHWGSDGGDFVTAAVAGRVPHPPGFPLYWLFTRLMVTIFRGDPAYILNIFSSFMAYGALSVVALDLRSRGMSWSSTIASVLTLGFSVWFWSQAIITEVYSTAACFTALAFYLRRNSDSPLLIGLVLGMAVSVHPLTLFMIPILVPDQKANWHHFFCGLLCGLLIYTMIPLSGPWPQPWGDMRTFSGWLHYVTARLYWGNAFALPLTRWPSRVLAWIVLMIRQFTPLGTLLVFVGLRYMWFWNRSETIRMVIALSLASFYAVGYNTVDSWVYLVAFMPLLSIVLGYGMKWSIRQGLPKPILLLLPIMLVAFNGILLDISDDNKALLWIELTLSHLPDNALIMTIRDDHTFALWYATEVLRQRTDLMVVNQGLWGYEPYVKFLSARIGLEVADLEDLMHNRPVCRIEFGEVLCP